MARHGFRPRTRTSYRRLRTALIVAVVLLVAFLYFGGASSTTPYAQAALHRGKRRSGEPKIGKASMLYGRRNELYERALASHDAHNLIHGYPMQVLRYDMTKGYWNKLSWLLSLVVQEMAKPERERLDWIMWVDARNILLNPQIPLSAFLPPSQLQFENIHFLGSRKNGDLCGGTFFVRVHPWTLTLLVRAMSLPMFGPEIEAELGYNKDINALAFVLNETVFATNTFYQPRAWYNTLDHIDAADGGDLTDEQNGFEGQGGELLVQFPTSMEGARWKHMADWFETLRRRPGTYVVPYDRTWYPKTIQDFWYRVMEAQHEVWAGDRAVMNSQPKDHERELLPALTRLRDTIQFTPDDDEAMVRVIEDVKKAVNHVYGGHL